MKKKIFLTIILTLLFVCVLSITTNAAEIEYQNSVNYDTYSANLFTANKRFINGVLTDSVGFYTRTSSIGLNVRGINDNEIISVRYDGNISNTQARTFDINAYNGSHQYIGTVTFNTNEVGVTKQLPSGTEHVGYGIYYGNDTLDRFYANVTYNVYVADELLQNVHINYYDNNNQYISSTDYLHGIGKTLNPMYANQMPLNVLGYTAPSTSSMGSIVVNTEASLNVFDIYGYVRQTWTYYVRYRYLDNGVIRDLKTKDTFTAQSLSNVTISALDFDGYECTEESKTVTLNQNYKYIDFMYEVPRTTANYTVRYSDTNGSLLTDTYIGTADIGETVNIEPVEIVGYTPTLSSASIFIDEDSAENVYTFNYTKNSYTYNVYYKNADNVEIATSISNTALYGSTVNLTAPEIVGYTPEVATYSMLIGASGNDYTFVYDIAQYPYTINFEDSNGNVLSTPLTGQAYYGFTVNESAVSITGYTPNVQGCSITIGSESNVFTFIYSPASYAYTVNYVNSDNEILSTAYTASAYYGENVELIPREVLGYTPELSSYILTIGNENNVYTFVYSVNSYPYTVRYVDIDNVELVVSTNGTANYGETVTANAVGIVGYETATETKSIVIGVEDNEIVFTYTVVEVPVVPPDTPDTPSDTGEFGTGENEEADLNVLQFIRAWFGKVWELLTTIEIPVLKVTAAAFLIALFLIGLVINLIGYVIGVQFGTVNLPATAKTFKQHGGNNGKYKINEKRKNDRF